MFLDWLNGMLREKYYRDRVNRSVLFQAADSYGSMLELSC